MKNVVLCSHFATSILGVDGAEIAIAIGIKMTARSSGVALYRALLRATKPFTKVRAKMCFNVREAFVMTRRAPSSEVESLRADGGRVLKALNYLAAQPQEIREVIFKDTGGTHLQPFHKLK